MSPDEKVAVFKNAVSYLKFLRSLELPLTSADLHDLSKTIDDLLTMWSEVQ